MFRVIVAVTIISGTIWIYKTIRQSKISTRSLWSRIKNELLVFKNINEYTSVPRIVRLRKALYWLTLILFLALAISAYLQVLVTGGPLTGWLLIIHVTAAPFFAVSLLLTILLWAHRQRFDRQDWFTLREIIRQKNITAVEENHRRFWDKFNFWIFMLASIPAMVSIIFQLYPLFDSQGMEFLLQIHRYSTLILSVVLIIHWRIMLQRLNNNSD
jgi:cytochrome b subunit of formate dehydrogenase